MSSRTTVYRWHSSCQCPSPLSAARAYPSRVLRQLSRFVSAARITCAGSSSDRVEQQHKIAAYQPAQIDGSCSTNRPGLQHKSCASAAQVIGSSHRHLRSTKRVHQQHRLLASAAQVVSESSAAVAQIICISNTAKVSAASPTPSAAAPIPSHPNHQ